MDLLTDIQEDLTFILNGMGIRKELNYDFSNCVNSQSINSNRG